MTGADPEIRLRGGGGYAIMGVWVQSPQRCRGTETLVWWSGVKLKGIHLFDAQMRAKFHDEPDISRN